MLRLDNKVLLRFPSIIQFMGVVLVQCGPQVKECAKVKQNNI